MVTLGGFVEFEHAVPKMSPASPYALAMVAGDSLLGNRLAGDVAASLTGATPDLAEIARRLVAQYGEVRRASLEEQILIPRGLDLASFYASHNALNPQVVALLDSQMANFNLGVELLLAGVDGSGAHIYTIQNPGGTERLHDPIGYTAIGSGAIHAIQSMIGFGHSPQAEYHQTVFRVYASKRRAEKAPGVGLDTDISVISANGTHWLSDAEMEQLKKIFEDFETSTDAALKDKLADFKIEGETEPNGSKQNGD